MSIKITEKENYLRCLHGERPYWVPSYSFGPMPGAKRPCTSAIFQPPFINSYRRGANDGKDVWGVKYVGSASTAGGLLPEPGNFQLEDITQWRDVVKAVDLSEIDFEAQAKEGLDNLFNAGFNREDSCIEFNMHAGYFQDLVGLMGFEGALIAMAEEPEEVKALLSYMCDWYTTVLEKMIDIVKPDCIGLADDVATWRAPFMSEEAYRELILPWHDREAKFGRDRGLPITMHCCGQAMDLVEDWMSIGVVQWNPAQTSNDLKAIKAKYGNKMVIAGGWDGRDRLLEPDVTEEEIRQSVRDTMDSLAKGGGFMWCGGFLGSAGDGESMRKNMILMDEAAKYGDAFYGYGPDIQRGFKDGKGYTAPAGL